MGCFLTIDPGKKILGFAYFEGGELQDCGLSKAKSSDAMNCLVQHKINLRHYLSVCPRVVAERMESRGKFSPVRMSDLLDLQLISGSLGTEFLTPRQWKGTASRTVEQNRTANVLSARELALLEALGSRKGEAHNAWSAVGIGVHGVLKRKLRVAKKSR